MDNINDFFEFKLATVLRDKEENFISNQSTLNKKNSNIFGSINKKFSENVNLKYNFSIDNDYSTFEYNDLNASFSINNIVTNFNFIKETNDIGNTNVLKTSVSYNPDNKNSFSFSTRRNRKINLTEYYDLVYEYKNDCLIAGIKYNKTYYSDRDLKPSENLLFTISLVPLTTYEYEADKLWEIKKMLWKNLFTNLHNHNFIFFNIGLKSSENKILVKVNNQIITSLDIASEIKYLKTINVNLKKFKDSNVIEIAKKSLIREKIKEIELKKIFKEIKNQDEFFEEISKSYFDYLGINSVSEFNNFFYNEGIDPDEVKKKITLEILWNQFIYKKFYIEC